MLNQIGPSLLAKPITRYILQPTKIRLFSLSMMPSFSSIKSIENGYLKNSKASKANQINDSFVLNKASIFRRFPFIAQ